MTVDGKAIPIASATENGRRVDMVTVDQKPGQQAVVVATLSTPASPEVADSFTTTMQITPGVTTWGTTEATFSHC